MITIMKIALFHNLPSGGAKRAVFEWVRRLAENHSIDVFSLSTADHVFCDIQPFAKQHTVFGFVSHRLFESPFGRLNQLQRWRDLGSLDAVNLRIAAEINSRGYDVLFAHTCKFTFVPAILQYTEFPSAYYLHEPFGPGFERHFNRPYLRKDGWRKSLNRFDPLIKLYQHRLSSIQKLSITKTKKLLANSHFTGECIQSIFGQPTTFCPLGVDLNDFYPIAGSSRGGYIVSVGEMSPRKGFDLVVESLGKIPSNQRPALKLACNRVNMDELGYLNSLAELNGVDMEVLIDLSIDQLRLLYNQARLCVYAPVKEPFGLVPLEAMACGTPVIGVREGGVPESVVHEYTGLLVERDVQQLSDSIQYLISKPELGSIYGRNGRDHVLKNWTWDQSVTLLEKYLVA